MFKMGCSMAKRILAIDGKNSPNSSNQHDFNSTNASTSSSSKKSKDKSSSSQQAQASAAAGGGQEGAKTRASGDELNDFSKLEDDPRIPLNVRQIFKITKSWKAIARTMSKTGTAMFLNLFEQNQDLFYLFDRFQHLKGKDLHESMELREHAATVMSTLDHSINSLSDYDNFVTYLHSIGKLHRKVPGFKRDHFWKIEQPFLKAVKQTLDERCNETIEEIYKIAIKLIIETIAEGYGEDQSTDSLGASANQKSTGGGNGNGSGSSSRDNEQQQNGDGSSNTKGGGNGGGGSGRGPIPCNDNSVNGFAKNHCSSANNDCLLLSKQQQQSHTKPPPLCNIDTTAAAATNVRSKIGRDEEGNKSLIIDKMDEAEISGEFMTNKSANESPTGCCLNEGLRQREETLFALRDLLAMMVDKQRQQKKENKLETIITNTKMIDTTRTNRPNGKRAAGVGVCQGNNNSPRERSCSLINYGEPTNTTTTNTNTKLNELNGNPMVVREDVVESNWLLLGGGEKCCSAGKINHSPISIHSLLPSRPSCLQHPNDKVDAHVRQNAYNNKKKNNNNTTNLGDSIYGSAATSIAGEEEKNDGKANQPMGSQFPSQRVCKEELKSNRIGFSEQYQTEKNARFSSSSSSSSHFPLNSHATKLNESCEQTLDCLTLMCGGSGNVSSSLSTTFPDSTTTIAKRTTNNTSRYSADCSGQNDKSATQLSNKLSGTFKLNGCKQDSVHHKPQTTASRSKGCRWTSSVWSQIKQSTPSSLVNRKRRKSADNNGETIQQNSIKCIDTTERRSHKEKRRFGGGNFTLTNNPDDLCELIKMLMLTVASRRAGGIGCSLYKNGSETIDCLS